MSRQAAEERQSASSHAWVRFQINDMAKSLYCDRRAGGADGRRSILPFAGNFKGDGPVRASARLAR